MRRLLLRIRDYHGKYLQKVSVVTLSLVHNCKKKRQIEFQVSWDSTLSLSFEAKADFRFFVSITYSLGICEIW